ncbi:hypothetical protein CXG81DRAFT_23742 [Caulochytrium protostelioides]|uniref:Uncharacterized protein n=1 Tax=Caulochytrium protostelioides TaxID=1555241 RepID=A0A4P9XDT4_9FUNG|nr:hypothetical protein CXG81DRAFT_23742 [Caulochytrium protostelioides]|eukprot:RKP03632.1 hypothetical protein CXG81DRAFT_23742 [Caulochytrium protostelioides]
MDRRGRRQGGADAPASTPTPHRRSSQRPRPAEPDEHSDGGDEDDDERAYQGALTQLAGAGWPDLDLDLEMPLDPDALPSDLDDAVPSDADADADGETPIEAAAPAAAALPSRRTAAQATAAAAAAFEAMYRFHPYRPARPVVNQRRIIPLDSALIVTQEPYLFRFGHVGQRLRRLAAKLIRQHRVAEAAPLYYRYYVMQSHMMSPHLIRLGRGAPPSHPSATRPYLGGRLLAYANASLSFHDDPRYLHSYADQFVDDVLGLWHASLPAAAFVLVDQRPGLFLTHQAEAHVGGAVGGVVPLRHPLPLLMAAFPPAWLTLERYCRMLVSAIAFGATGDWKDVVQQMAQHGREEPFVHAPVAVGYRAILAAEAFLAEMAHASTSQNMRWVALLQGSDLYHDAWNPLPRPRRAPAARDATAASPRFPAPPSVLAQDEPPSRPAPIAPPPPRRMTTATWLAHPDVHPHHAEPTPIEPPSSDRDDMSVASEAESSLAFGVDAERFAAGPDLYGRPAAAAAAAADDGEAGGADDGEADAACHDDAPLVPVASTARTRLQEAIDLFEGCFQRQLGHPFFLRYYCYLLMYTPARAAATIRDVVQCYVAYRPQDPAGYALALELAPIVFDAGVPGYLDTLWVTYAERLIKLDVQASYTTCVEPLLRYYTYRARGVPLDIRYGRGRSRATDPLRRTPTAPLSALLAVLVAVLETNPEPDVRLWYHVAALVAQFPSCRQALRYDPRTHQCTPYDGLADARSDGADGDAMMGDDGGSRPNAIRRARRNSLSAQHPDAVRALWQTHWAPRAKTWVYAHVRRQRARLDCSARADLTVWCCLRLFDGDGALRRQLRISGADDARLDRRVARLMALWPANPWDANDGDASSLS